MEKISFQLVQDSIDEICNLSEDSELEAVSEDLFQVQPHLTQFFVDFIEDMGDDAQNLGFMMALILNRAFLKKFSTLRQMGEDEVIEKFESQGDELEKWAGFKENLMVEVEQEINRQKQPDVLKYVVEELFMDPELEPELGPQEPLHLFIICKFFIDCLQSLAEEESHSVH